MTSISSSVARAETRAAPSASTRNAALDRARTFLTLVVVLHHSVIPYTYFGHTDRGFRHRAAGATRYQVHRVLVEDDHRPALAKRPDLVHLGVAGFRSF